MSSKMSKFEQKKIKICKETRKYDPYTGEKTESKKQSVETLRKHRHCTQFNKESKFIILNMFKEIKYATSKELWEIMRTMSHQTQDIDKEIETI